MKMPNFKYLKSVSLVAAALPFAVQAQTETGSVVSLPETVITGSHTDARDSQTVELDPSLTSKLDAPLNEIPRSVDIITTEQFTEKGSLNLQETLNYTPGVFAGAFGLDTRIDTNRVRGLSPEQFQDGFQAFEGFYNAPRVEVFTLDSVEVIKGPASTLFGQGALGGIINTNSKLPKAEASGELNLQVGSNNRLQTAIDITGPLDEDETLLYRVVALSRDSGTEVDYVDDDAVVFMPSITWQPTEDTKLTLLANHQEQETGSSIQFISNLDSTAGTLAGPAGADTLTALSELNIDPKTFVGEPDFDRYDTESTSFSAILEHRFNDTFSLAANARYWDSESVYQYTQSLGYSAAGPGTRFLIGSLPILDTDGDTYRVGYKSDKTLNILATNAILKAEGNWFGLEHNAKIGLDYIKADSEDDRARDAVLEAAFGRTLSGYFLTDSKINVLNPVYTGSPTVPTATEYRDSSNQQTGLFLSDVVKSDNLITSLNVRYDYVRQSYNRKGIDPSGSDSTNWTDSMEDVNFDAGFMYQFDNGVSPYYSYAESFTPNEADPDGNLVAPREGNQHEIGVKYLSSDSDTFVTAAIFKIDEDNRVTNTDPASFRVINATYKGAEFSVNHRIDDFYLQGSYTYLDTEQRGDTSASEVANVPDNMANAWVSYVPSGGDLKGFQVGLGARYIGNTLSDNNTYETPSYTLFDAMLGYSYRDIDLKLNVTNLTDKDYTVAISESAFGTSSYQGPGRFVGLTASYAF